MIDAMLLLLAATTTATAAAAPPASDPATWTPQQRATIEKVLKRASIVGQRLPPRDVDAQRARGGPVALTRGVAQYPRYDLEEDVYGCVQVSFDILPNGKTDGFEVVRADPPGVFDTLAMGVVMATDFEKAPSGTGIRRHQKSVFVLVPRPVPALYSRLNQRNQDERDARRAVLRAACEGGTS
jgi:TonB family protein